MIQAHALFGERQFRDEVAIRILAIAQKMQRAADHNEPIAVNDQMISDIKLAALCVAASEVPEPME
jgi:hypothetical protein